MFTLYRKRGFNELISDTFAFLKKYGSHFFKNYLIITGGFTLVICAIYYLLFKVYFEILFSAIGSGNPGYIEQNIENNLPLVFLLVSILFVVGVLSFIVNLSFPVVYKQLISENKTDFSSLEVFNAMKKHISKYFIFLLGTIFIFIPIIMVAAFISVLLFFVIIGIPIMLILIPFIIGWMNLSLYFYLNEPIGFFESMGKGFDGMTKNFWPATFSNLIMVVIIQVVLGVITMIPYMIYIFSFLVPAIENNADPAEPIMGMGIVFLVLMIVSVILNLILSNLIWINNGMLYYSLKETDENKQTIDNIDLIGTSDE